MRHTEDELSAFYNSLHTLYKSKEAQEGAKVFACHAAYPAFISVDLLYRIRQNFRNFKQHGQIQFIDIPEIAVSDIIHAPFTRRIAYDLYQIEDRVRKQLREKLREDERFGPDREILLAKFLKEYVQKHYKDVADDNIMLFQKMVAESTLDPEGTWLSLDDKLHTALDKKQKGEQFRIFNMIDGLTNRDEVYEQLLNRSEKAYKNIPAGEGAATKKPVLTLPDSDNAELVRIKIPEHLKGTPALQKLKEAQSQPVEKDPPDIVEMVIEDCIQRKLMMLDLSNNGLKEVPGKVYKMYWLETLILGNYRDLSNPNTIKRISSQIAKLKNLEVLNLNGVGFGKLPVAISKLNRLHTLLISDNNLKLLPRFISKISTLQTLDVSHTRIDQLPGWFFSMKKLKVLDLSYTPFHTLTDRLAKLPELEELYLKGTKITALPPSILNMPSLKKLDVRECPIEGLPEELKNDLEALRAFYKEISEADEEKWVNAQLVVLGPPGVGKTIILNRLMGGVLHRIGNSTKGILVLNWETELNDTNVNLSIWEMGGQLIYQSMLSLIPSNNVTYLLVIDGESQSELDEWLKIIGGRKTSPVIVAINTSDTALAFNAPVSKFLRRRKHPVVDAFFSLSAFDGKGVEPLKDKILELAIEVGHRVKTPISWQKIKDEVLNHKSGLMQFYQFEHICQDHHIPLGDINTIITYFHDTGVLLFFNESRLNDWMIRTDTLFNLASEIYNDLRYSAQWLDTEELSVIMERAQIPERATTYVTALLQKLKIIYRSESEPVTFLVPALLKEASQLPPIDNDYTNWVYIYEDLPENFEALIFKGLYGGKYISMDIWKGGVSIDLEQNILYFIINEEEHSLTVSVNNPEGYSLLKKVHSDIQAYVHEPNKITSFWHSGLTGKASQPDEYQHDIYLSYSHGDRYWVKPFIADVVKELEKVLDRQLRIFENNQDYKNSELKNEQYFKILERSQFYIPIITDASRHDLLFKTEPSIFESAVKKDESHLRRTIIPVVALEVDKPHSLVPYNEIRPQLLGKYGISYDPKDFTTEYEREEESRYAHEVATKIIITWENEGKIENREDNPTVKIKNVPRVFLSYSWENKDLADEIDHTLSQAGVQLIRDTRDLKHGDDIWNFMQQTTESADYAILLISDTFLKSPNCIYEVMELTKRDGYSERILPILVNVNIANNNERQKYYQYWKTKLAELGSTDFLSERTVSETFDEASKFSKEVSMFTQISYSIESFLKNISQLLVKDINDLQSENYQSLLDAIGHPAQNFKKDFEKILSIKNNQKKLKALNQLIDQYPHQPRPKVEKGWVLMAMMAHQEAYEIFDSAIDDDNNYVSAWVGRAEALKAGRQYDEAIKDYDYIREHFSDDIRGWVGRVEVFTELGYYDKALEMFPEITERFKDNPIAYLTYVNILKKAGRLEEALREVIDLTEMFEGNIVVYTTHAEILKSLGRLEEALKVYSYIESKFPDSVFAYSGTADTLKLMGQLEDALKVYSNAAELFPDAVFAYTGAADTLKLMGRLEEALKVCFNAIERFPDAIFAYTGAADTLKSLGQLEEVLQVYSNAIERFPNSIFAYTGKAEVLHSMGLFNKALDAYSQAMDRFPNNVLPFMGYAGIMKETGNTEEALDWYKKIVIRFPNSAAAYTGFANTLASLNRHEEALEIYLQTIERFPDDINARTGYAQTLISLGKINDAIRNFDKAIQIDPNSAHALLSRGIAFSSIGKTVNALHDLTRTIEIDPLLLDAYIHRGKVYQEIGESKKAKADFDKARELGWEGDSDEYLLT